MREVREAATRILGIVQRARELSHRRVLLGLCGMTSAVVSTLLFMAGASGVVLVGGSGAALLLFLAALLAPSHLLGNPPR